MYNRIIEPVALEHMGKRRCLTLIGPRQSGKTTLCKKLFRQYEYFSFETPDIRDLFYYDPRGFLLNIKKGAVFDEVQKVPDLLSYLQEILDDADDKRKFILTGSNNLQLSQKISQTLSGRTKILQLLPLQRDEISPEDRKIDLDSTMLFGSYPRIYNEKLDPSDWLGDYLNTYVEKDIRDTINITNLRSFNNFLRLLAGRAGQILSSNSLAGDSGVTQPTVKRWISALETTYICFVLQPHLKNFNKRITKAPKVFFYDTGLLCYLLRIRNTRQLKVHPLRGAIFENWVLAEYMKYYSNMGKEAPLYFWRDQHGHEVDLVIDQGPYLDFFEIKSSMTYQKEYFNHIDWLNKQQGTTKGACIYGGEKRVTLGDKELIPWNELFSHST
jgi:predicted AAA+ superfamily ATPase